VTFLHDEANSDGEKKDEAAGSLTHSKRTKLLFYTVTLFKTTST